MGAVSTVVGVAATGVGILQQNSQASAQRRQIRAQVDANNKSLALKQLDVYQQRQFNQLNSMLAAVNNKAQFQQQIADLNLQAAMTKSSYGSQLQETIAQNELIRNQAQAQNLELYQVDQTRAYNQLAAEAGRLQETSLYVNQQSQRMTQISEAIREGKTQQASQLALMSLADGGGQGQSKKAYESSMQRRQDADELLAALNNNAGIESVLSNEALTNRLQKLFSDIEREDVLAAMQSLSTNAFAQTSSANAQNQMLNDQLSTFLSNVPKLEGITATQALLNAGNINAQQTTTDQALRNTGVSLDYQFAGANAQLLAQQAPQTGLLSTLAQLGLAGAPLLYDRGFSQQTQPTQSLRLGLNSPPGGLKIKPPVSPQPTLRLNALPEGVKVK